jgi:hypothetical protein
MDRTLFLGVIAALAAAAALAGWGLGWPGPALVAVGAGWARMQMRLGEVARDGGVSEALPSEPAGPDAVTAALPWGAAAAVLVTLAFLLLAP